MRDTPLATWQEAASGRWLRSLGLGRFGRTAIVLYATVVLMLGWSYGLWRIHNDRQVTLQAAHQQLATLSKGFASQIEAMVNDGVGAARAGANVLVDFPAVADRRRILGDMLTGGAYVRALFVVAGDQLIVANANGEKLSLENAVWLDDLRGSGQFIWTGPIEVEPDGVKLPIARRFTLRDGSASWAGALVRISDLEGVYRELLSSHTTLSMVSLAGRVIVQLPDARENSLDVDISNSLVYRQYVEMPRQSVTLMVGPRPVTGEQRQYAISRMDSLALLATASRSVDDILAEWNKRRFLSLQLLLVSTAIVYALAIALQSLLNRRFMALERSEARFQLAAAGTNDGLLEWEADTGMVYCTARALKLLQLLESAGSIAVDALRGLVHPYDLPQVVTAIRRHVDDQIALDLELRVAVAGEYRWFRIRGQALWNEAGEPVRLAGAIGDIHAVVAARRAVVEARRAELDAKESLARELLLAQEQERKRLASELHDGVGQNLSLLRNRVILLQRTELPAATVPHVKALLDLSTESIQDLRTVAQNLRPIHLEELGVSASLRSLLQRVEQSSEMKVDFRVEDIDDVIHADSATHVYRIVQEAINNVLKHAAAGSLNVAIIRDIASVSIDIRDNGKGCGPQSGRASAGLGLLSIRERCAILRAELAMESTEGKGTRLHVQIPLDITYNDAAIPGEPHV
jgi:two-component system, NarL family, sensor histidine kinase UhpB